MILMGGVKSIITVSEAFNATVINHYLKKKDVLV